MDSDPDEGPRRRALPRSPHVHVESSRERLSGRVFDVWSERVRLPSGLVQDLDVVVHGGAVAVLPLHADGTVLLVRQYRHAVGDWLLEIPAGRLEEGEDPQTAAARELEEETGVRAATWTPLGALWPAPGFCSESLHLFLARDLETVPGGGLAMDADEEIERVRVPLDELADRTDDAKSLVAAMRAQRVLEAD